MDIEVDPLASTPIYEQIRDRVVEAIAVGTLRRGDALLPVRALASAFGINPGTVTKAYDLLRQEGFVGANAKSGTFVACDPQHPTASDAFTSHWRARLTTLMAEGRAHGLTPGDLAQHAELVVSSFSPLEPAPVTGRTAVQPPAAVPSPVSPGSGSTSPMASSSTTPRASRGRTETAESWVSACLQCDDEATGDPR